MGTFRIFTANDYDHLKPILARSARAKRASFEQQQIRRLEERVQQYNKRFAYDHARGGTLPQNHDWRPYRFTVQNVLLGATVLRHSREHNCLEVDAFLTAHPPEYDPLAAAQALTCFLFSEAYKCGGSLELRFTQHVAGGQLPTELCALAERHGVALNDAPPGCLPSSAARMLYLALTGFAPAVQQRLVALDQAGALTLPRACYAVHHGVWSREQVELLVLGSRRPERLLAGLSLPQQRHIYQEDLLHARAAVLAGRLDRRLRHGDSTEGYVQAPLALRSSFLPAPYGLAYVAGEALTIPWIYPQRSATLPAGSRLLALVRARDGADFLRHLGDDLRVAQQLRERAAQPTLILIPYDFVDLPVAQRQRMLNACQQAKIGLLVCPESTLALDTEAAERLALSRLLRI